MKKTAFIYLFLLLFSSCSKDKNDDTSPDVKDTFLNLSLSTINFTAHKDASLVVVRTTGKWSASCDADWITLSAYEANDSTGFIIGASANNKFSRKASVFISSGKNTEEIKITQQGLDRIEFDINGVSFTLLPVIADTSFYLDGNTYLASRKVYLDSYYISETEITNAQWMAVVGSLPYDNENSQPNLPLVANWNTISEEFFPKLNALSDYDFRLPTENEWEVAARGALEDINELYAGSMYIDVVAWHWFNSEGKKHRVASLKPNELGLYDMSGNVSEWCSDWYEEWTEENNPPDEANNPTGPATGTEKVIRGGDFGADRFEYDQNSCRVVTRNFLPPHISTENFLYEGRYNHTGFRLVIAKN